MVTVTQHQLALAMAQRHMAAPSECQVLTVLIELITAATTTATAATTAAAITDIPAQKGISVSHGNSGSSSRSGSAANSGCFGQHIAAVVKSLLPAGLTKSQRRLYRVIDIAGMIDSSDHNNIISRNAAGSSIQQPVYRNTVEAFAIDSTSTSNSSTSTSTSMTNLSTYAYADACCCCNANNSSTPSLISAASTTSSSATADTVDVNNRANQHGEVDEEGLFRLLVLLRPQSQRIIEEPLSSQTFSRTSKAINQPSPSPTTRTTNQDSQWRPPSPFNLPSPELTVVLN
jgi:hypothetical protein